MRLSLFKRKPDPERIEVSYGGMLYPVMVKRRAAARRMTLRVSQASGEITLTLPERADFAAGRLFAENHGGWIAARLAKRPQLIPFEPGQTIPVRGTPHRIVHWSKARGLTRAFAGLRARGLKVRRPDLTFATTDHSTPTTPRSLAIVQRSSFW